ncbi:MAG: hypothetical protein JXA57_14515 [Armatimonadetes bacterium]|nr:hypothetical protein [Armatimonadota bacterium]
MKVIQYPSVSADTLEAYPDAANFPAVSSGLSATELTDASAAWTDSQFAAVSIPTPGVTPTPTPRYFLIPHMNGAPTPPYPHYQSYGILSNTSDTITIISGDMTTHASVGNNYGIFGFEPTCGPPTATPQTQYLTNVGWGAYTGLCLDAIPTSTPAVPVDYGVPGIQ